MVISSRPLSGLNGVLSRLFIANTLAFLGLFGGMVPEVSWHPTALVFRWSAYSQEFSPESINHYAKAVLAIEVERKKAFEEIQTLIGRVPPQLTCTNRDSIRKLPRNAQAIAVNFCNRSKQIAEESGLKPGEFNRITEAARNNANLKTQIQRAIINLRR
ncbi:MULTISPECIES: DUF4168 domain-containing protein [unclassified Synechocystis]|uniref:DUF4168 domain-containing protein n=1 Tax=unclassified Synechocystis TaxID=2640012 RepID=UPI00048F4D9E|nr:MULTISPECIES: DUF4168 domain-containing protein [unclassified Synechocystis]MCT0255237.1 DUF4168 domain-containing protein [Synechocystis sp. CS-94]